MEKWIIAWLLVGLALSPFSYAVMFAEIQGEVGDDLKGFYRDQHQGFALFMAFNTVTGSVLMFLAIMFGTRFFRRGLRWR